MAQNKVEGYSGSGSSAGATGRSASPLEGAVPSLEGAVPPLEGAALESMTGRAFSPGTAGAVISLSRWGGGGGSGGTFGGDTTRAAVPGGLGFVVALDMAKWLWSMMNAAGIETMTLSGSGREVGRSRAKNGMIDLEAGEAEGEVLMLMARNEEGGRSKKLRGQNTKTIKKCSTKGTQYVLQMVSNHDFWLVANRLLRDELSNCLSNC